MGTLTLKQIEPVAGYYRHTSAHLDGTDILMADLSEYAMEKAAREFCENRLPKGWRLTMTRNPGKPAAVAYTAHAAGAALVGAESVGMSCDADSPTHAYAGLGVKMERAAR
jgi:hypothetical protein